MRDLAADRRGSVLGDLLVPLVLGGLFFGFVASLLYLPGAMAEVESFATDRWITGARDARVNVRADRRELYESLRYEWGIRGKTMDETRALLGEPEAVRTNASDGHTEWRWALARDRVGSEDLLILVLGFPPQTGVVSSIMTDVGSLPPL